MKSSKKNRLNVIEQAIKDAHAYALEHCGVPLNKMPEYFLGVEIGKRMIQEFDNFSVRFEMSVKQLMAQAGIESAGDKSDRENGRFDLVLLTKRYGKPAHVIEIKRGVKTDSMLSDIKRLANICRYSKVGARLETNYFVAITRRSSTVVAERGKVLFAKSSETGCLDNITVDKSRVFNLDTPDGKSVTAAIYEVTYQYN
ncbi:hypothetical protein [Rheinheimera nanhaiensis]|uniref:hypothetical protein n=1 Tax=Rheinheimera nanhaiensis TaxID=1163621 RepID=UPI00058D7AC1|nr:hypothetical protein [Rheinheimera nanhaiensis]